MKSLIIEWEGQGAVDYLSAASSNELLGVDRMPIAGSERHPLKRFFQFMSLESD